MRNKTKGKLLAFVSRVAPILLAAFLIRSLVAVVGRFLFALPSSGADAQRFERTAAELAQSGIAGIIGNFTTGDCHRTQCDSLTLAFDEND